MEIGNKDECTKYLNELSEIYSLKMAFPTSESTDYERFYQLVKLVGDCDPTTKFIIEWTNSTAEIRSFSTYDDAYRFAYCDHLLRIIPFQTAID